MSPVSSSRLMKVVPPAVAGRCRWVTTPATSTLVPARRRADPTRSPRPGRRDAGARTWWDGRRRPHRWPTDQPWLLRARTCRATAAPRRPVTTPSKRPASDCATAPADHRARRRSSGRPSSSVKHSNAPAVANASQVQLRRPVTPSLEVLHARVRTAPVALGFDASARSSPSPRTEDNPSRTAG